MSWPPDYLTMHQETKLHGNIIFKTGSFITEDNRNLIDCLNNKCDNEDIPQEDECILITEDNKNLLTEDEKALLI